MKRALELGGNFLDTSNMYSNGVSEEILGRAVRDFARRDDVVIATKVYLPTGEGPNNGGLSRKHILTAVDDSLRRLGTDYIDLYQIHQLDHETPIEEMLETLHDLVRAGKVRYIGASSMFAWQFARALYLAERHGWTRFVSMQNHYNLIYREEEREMVPLCRAEGVGLIPWSPLARGFLARNRQRGAQGETLRAKSDDIAHRMYTLDSDTTVAERVSEIAQTRGVPPAQIALAWLLHKPGVVAPIIGASKMLHLEQAVAAFDVGLDAEAITQLEAPYQPHPILGHM